MTTLKAQRAAAVEARKQEAYTKKVQTLVGIIVARRTPVSQIAAGYAAGVTAEAFATALAAQEPVGAAVFALKAEAVQAASERARATVARVAAKLEEHGWSRANYAPYPKGYGANYAQDRARYSLVHSLTKEDSEARSAWHAAAPEAEEARREYFRAGWKEVCRMSESGIARFVAQAEEMAAAEYDAFVCKLVSKVGDCDSAALQGNHVWSYSILTVRKGDTVENWKTQQIWNVSKLGLNFPQWPTRLQKGR